MQPKVRFSLTLLTVVLLACRAEFGFQPTPTVTPLPPTETPSPSVTPTATPTQTASPLAPSATPTSTPCRHPLPTRGIPIATTTMALNCAIHQAAVLRSICPTQPA